MRRFRYKLTKKILGGLIILGGLGVFGNGYVGIGENVYAQQASETTTEVEEIATTETACKLKSETHIWNAATNTCMPLSTSASSSSGLWEILNMLLKIIYLLLWPLLVVAGLSLDNTMVYASVFHLDAPLWKFWNMMKNFANFTLGFMVLFAIIKNFFVQKDGKGPIDIIKKTLIAGVLIQASRFLMAALVDISTIATYAVGGLPLSIVKNTDIGQRRILHVSSKIDLDKFSNLNDAGDAFQVRYTATYKPTNKQVNISPCRIEENYIIGRELGDPKFKNTDIFTDSYYPGHEVCVAFNNQLVVWNEDALMSGIKTVGYFGQTTGSITDFDSHIRYQGYMINLTNTSGWETLQLVKDYAVNIKSGQNAPGFIAGSGFYASTTSLTIGELINKSKGFVGPLVTMYSSLLNFANLTDTQTTTLGQTSGIFLIKTGVAIALFFPLLALAIVLVARIALLWLYIAASPFLVLKKVFDDAIPKDLLGKLGEHLELGNVFKLIFAPVITVAALSISLIFMSALIQGFEPEENQQISSKVAENLEIQPIPTADSNNQTYLVNGSHELEFENFDRGGSLDRFSRLVVNFFAIGILWTILFAAIKANALGAKIGAGIQEFGANVFQTMPVVPIPGMEGKVGFGTAMRELPQAPQRWVERREQAQRSEIIERFSGGTPGGTNDKNALSNDQINTLIERMKTAPITPANLQTYLTEQNITATPGEVATASAGGFYSAIAGLSDLTEQTTILQNMPTELKKPINALAKDDLDTNVINTMTESNTVDDIQNILNNEANKKYLDTYFNSTTEREYTAAVGNKQVTITATDDGNSVFTYTGTAPTEPPQPTPENTPIQ